MKTWLAAALCVLAFGSSAALAEADTFGVGSGRNLALSVDAPDTFLNSYAPVTTSLAVGSTSIPIGACTGNATCFGAGDLVLVYQTTGLETAPTPEPVDISATSVRVGRWEFARLAKGTMATQLELTAPLVRSYAANGTQVIRVPEYTNVTISSTGSITAPAWNGSTGGIVAFLASGTVNNNGLINASALGFRGGQYVSDTTGSTGCAGLNEPAPTGAQKGEGIANTSYGPSQTGRGNVANGAGGGVCQRAGGGGGGHGGVGGKGGRSSDTSGRDVGGLGGAALTYAPLPLTQMTFGGGGGAGHGTAATGVPGGTGGGAIFIRASQLTGSGNITASGGLASTPTSTANAGGGGGAGGFIHLRFVRTADCNAIAATGGIGASVNALRVGPGGGGGGGQVLFQAEGGTCPIIANGAASGIQLETTEPAYGAQSGANGSSTVLPGGFVVPAPPTIITPRNGAVTSNRRPPITGQALPAGAGIEVIIYIDDNEAGRVTSDASGNYTFTPTADLPDGPHTVQAVSEVLAARSLRSATNIFTVDTTPPDTSILSGPTGFTRQSTATFQFSATELDVTYECSLNGADFTLCPPITTLEGLVEGGYTLQVRARDAAGNVDESPATRSFRITGADLALLGSGCSATGGDASWVLLGLGTLSALIRRRRRDE